MTAGDLSVCVYIAGRLPLNRHLVHSTDERAGQCALGHRTAAVPGLGRGSNLGPNTSFATYKL